MNDLSPNHTPKKSTIKLARKQLKKSPIQYRKRRKSSIPLKLRQFITNNNINKIDPKLSCKNNFQGEISSKNEQKEDIINTNIPEVSENSSNIKEERKTKIKKIKHKKKNNNDNNNYFIHYIKNVYENESHLNKENIIKSAKKNINDSFLKFVESNKTFHNTAGKRRNSAFNGNFMKSNFHNINLGLDKEQLNRKVPYSIINKKKSAEIGTLLHKKNLDNKEKEIVKKYFTKSKHKNKDNKHKDKDKTIKNSDIATHKKKIKEKETLAEENENENKVNTENNIETIKTKKQSKIKKFLCCIINDNCDSSIEKK
jgi:hypothetical protein